MSKHFSEIKGAGGGGGGNSSPPYEAPDSLSSTSEARMLYALSEGRIGGLVEGARSVFLDGTRVQNVDGTNNFSRVIVETRAGTPDQSPISGFDSVQSETSVGVEVKRATPVVRTVNDPNADRLRVTVGHQGLLQQTDNGDRVNANVRYIIEVRPSGGVYQTVVDHDEYGKTKARFQRSHTFSLPPGGNPWDVRITRLTDDSTTDKVVNPLAWDTYATIIDAKISYKNTALLALGLDAREFSSLPRVEVELYGKDDIRIPSNYDPLTRTYSGAWDGTFKTGYTNNPVWIFNDLVLAKRYGLGQRIPAELMNKWALYRIAKYCDEYVPDGFGGLEPRFTCNIDLRGAAEDAYKVLNRLVSVFRAMLYWAGGVINAVQDAPVDVVSGVFSHANVVDGKFSYAGSPRRERHTVVIVKYRNPDDNYRYAFEPVEHPEMLAKYGPRILEVEAVGCTSRGQAARFGRWILWTEWNETDVVTFTAGFDAAMLTPGAVIMVSDAVRQGGRHGGRLQAGSTASVLQLDSQVEVTASGFTVACVLPDGSVQSRGVLNAPGQTSQLMLDTPLSAEPVLNAMWTVKHKLFRVVKVTESDQHLFEVSAVEHSPGKYAEVEGGVYFDPDDVALTPSPVEVVTVSGLQLSKYAVIERGGYVRSMLSASWDRPDTPYALRYAVQWQQPDGSWSDPEIVLGLSAETEAAKQGQYKIRVSTANNLGRWSPYIESNVIAVDGSEVAPDVPGPTSLALVSAWAGLEFIASWQRVDIANGYRVRVELPNGSLVQEAWVAKALEYKFSYDLAKAAGKVSRTYVIKVRAELDNGAASDWVSISVANPVPAVLAGVQVQPGYKAIDVKLEPDTSADVAGYRVWVSTAPNTAVGATTLAYDGPNPQAYLTTGPGGLPLEAGVTYYVRAAAYDVWGSEVNPTSAVTAVPVSVAGGIKPGEITSTMIAAVEAAKVQGQLQDVQIAGVNASKIAGQLVDSQIAAVNAAKVAGQLVDSQIGAVSAGKIAGLLAAGQLAAIEANKLIGQVQLSQLSGDVQGSLSSAVSTANQALVKANEAATATSVSQLQARVDAMSSNLLPVDLWKPNGQPLPAPWRNNVNAGIEQTLVSLPGPYGDATTVLRAVAAGGDNDGGWDVDVKIDNTKAYRFSVWIKDVSGSAGTAYLGIQAVQQGGVDVPNPYFIILPKTAMTDGVWHLFVGYVYPVGSALPANAHSAVYEGTTGNVVFLGNDYTWAPYAEWVSPRCYQYYAPNGAEQWFAHPRFEVIDGREPSIAELLSGAGLSVARSAITRVSSVEAALPGKANASDVTSLQGRVTNAESNVSSALSRVGAVEAALPGKANASDVTNLTAEVRKRKAFRLTTWGNSYDGLFGGYAGLRYADGPFIGGYNRSYTVVQFDSAGGVVDARYFDVYGAGEASPHGGAAQMAAHLNGMPAGALLVIYSSDEPKGNRLTAGLAEAMYRCGATEAIFGSSSFTVRSVYVLIGKVSGKQGTAFEAYRGDYDSDPHAFLDLGFDIVDGNFVGISPAAGATAGASLNRVAAVEAALPGKASATDLANLQGRVSSAEANVGSALTRVGAVEAALPGKASASDVTSLQGRVTNAESNVSSALNRVGAVEAALPGKANASDLTALSASVMGQSLAIYVPGDRGIFYPVGVSVGTNATGLQTSWHVYRDQVHLDGDWTGSYSAEVTARVSAWGNVTPEVLRVLQRTGAGNKPWGLGDAAASRYNWHVVLFLRGGMTHNVRCLSHPGAVTAIMPGADTNLVLPQNNETFGAFYENAAPLAQYLNYDWRPNGVLTQNSVAGLPQVVNDVSAQNTRLSTVEAALPGKASATDVSTLQGRVTTNEGQIASTLSRVSAVEAALPGKASASDVTSLQGRVANAESNVSSALSRVGAVEAALPGKASASDLVSLQATVERTKANLLSTADWTPGSLPPWYTPNGYASENSIVYGVGPYGEVIPLWKGVADGGNNDDGGWNTVAQAVDVTKMYRLSVWVKPVSGTGSVYFGTSHCFDLTQGIENGNPYFLIGGHGPGAQDYAVPNGKWYLLVGYIMPASYTGPARGMSAAYDGETGQVMTSVYSYDMRFLPNVPMATHRAYQYYASAGAEQLFALPRFEMCDGKEPSIAELLSGATAARVTAQGSRLSTVEAALPGKASASDVATLSARVGNAESSVTTVAQSVATVSGQVSGKFGVALGASLPDGRRKLSGFQAMNDGSVSQFVITADQMLIQPSGSCINLDPNFTDASHWIVDPGPNANPEIGFVTSAAGAIANTCVYARNASGTAEASVWLRSRELFPIDASRTYRLSGAFFSDLGNGRVAYLAILLYDSSGTMLFPGWGGSWSGYPWAGTPVGGQFTEYSGTFGAGTGLAIPSNATQARVGVILNYGTGGDGRRMAAQGVRLEEVLPSTLIKNGAITTDKVAANAVTADKIAANSVNATHIVGGTITGDKVAANAITGDKLAANSVTTDKLAAGSVTTPQLAAGAVTADKINVTSLSAITANIGTLQSAPSGARTVITNSLVSVYDANNVLRVRLGVW